ncbi:MAG: alkaline phosphatase family protein [Terriglobales bacterium]
MRLPRIYCAAALLLRVLSLVGLLAALCAPFAVASAYNAHPKLIVVIVIDQFRGDYLERYHDQFVEGGFRVFLDRGAYFTDCNYDYANTRTAPGHATLFTGSYTSGHGIVANEWWDPLKKKSVTSVEDDAVKLIGLEGAGAANGPGASPHNLLSDTLGDELKLATGGKARVFAISLKDRAAVLPAGFAGDGAYWIDPKSGAWITSTYYEQDLPEWVRNFNSSHRAEKYWNREWKDADGKALGSTAPRSGRDGKPAGFYEVVGATPFANDYQFEFAKELVLYEKLGTGPVTDLLVISLSANDILGHRVGPDSPQMRSMALELDRGLAEFFGFLGHQIGLANVWLALSADHGIAPLPEYAKALRLPSANLDTKAMQELVNSALSKKYNKAGNYVLDVDYPDAWLNEEAFLAAARTEAAAETDAGEALMQSGFAGYFAKSELTHGQVPNTEIGRRYAHSYSPEGGWYVLGVPKPFQVGTTAGTDHATPFSYDTHVPLAFYGLAFQPGVYRTHAEPTDLAVTLASLLGINPPVKATGRVLTEALAPPHRTATGADHTVAPPAGDHTSGPAESKR